MASSNSGNPDSPTSADFNTDRLPPYTSNNYTTDEDNDDEAAVDPEIIRDEEPEPEDEEEGEDLYNDNFLDDYRRMDENDQYESMGLDDSLEDERDLDQIMQDRRAAEVELETRDARLMNRKLPQLLHDNGELSVCITSCGLFGVVVGLINEFRTGLVLKINANCATDALGNLNSEVELFACDTDDDNYRPSKRSRADHRRPPVVPRSNDDTDGMQSSPGRSQPGYPRDDVHMTDQTDDYEDEDGDEAEFEMYRVQGTLREWVTRDEVRRFIARKFEEFLLSYVNPKNGDGDFEYVRLINEMVAVNKCSLEIDYKQFIYVHPNIAIWLADAPQSVLEVMEEVAGKVVFNLFPNYKSIHQKIYVRITNLPVYDQIRNIRQIHLNTMIRIGGVVTRRSGVFPQLQQVKYDCNKCGAILGPFFQNSYSEVKVGSCPECQSKGPFTVNIEQTVYRNYQKLTLQESPGIVPAGRLPRHKEVILLNDLIDCARPGEEIEVTGIYTNNFDLSLNTKNGFPVFATVIEANYITKKQDLFSAYKLTQEDKDQIDKLSKDPRIGERIIKSIAPSIYGHDDIKTAIALAMFGGQEKNVEGKHRLRGDINVLLLGDPGTAKSQFLKYVEKTGQRAVYTTGKGASAVGLTAAVHKDPVTREWTLEGGALVLADKGICLIDEFDKMNDQDRVSIHEAMEQQSISISKAGIVTSLQARCSVIAAANPIGGRYDSSKNFTQNVELTDPIISRFDILCVVKDVVDPVSDEMLAKFVVDSHFKSRPKGANMDDRSINESQEDIQASAMPVDPEILPQDLLKKYITYAKLNVFPKLHDSDMEKLTRVYAELRRESSHGQGVPIAVRHIESMIRMSEAHARMHLRHHVTEEDVNMAIQVLLSSFISTQKYGVQRALQKSFKRYITSKRDYNGLLIHLLRELVKRQLRLEEILSGSTAGLTHVEVKVEDLLNEAQSNGISDLRPFFSGQDFSANNFELDEVRKVIKHRLPRQSFA
ncbi:MCM DNA helicase complex subunit [Turnera subulata]|uniref:DNA replication licensing factor MCM2 n=1 Tax=Turnera subulata TaxID=218843 RepID=A0A9Q0J2L1_9ROSI|nr:MCM DNA helicase complex subunit [Turnera subulata]